MSTALGSRQTFIDFVHAQPLGVVATADASGRPAAALVSFAVTDTGDLLFDTRADARKVVNLTAAARVALVIGCTGDMSVQLEGDAAVLTGTARTAAARTYEARFPGSSALAEGFVIVRVRPRWLRSYDVRTTPPTVAEGVPAWA